MIIPQNVLKKHINENEIKIQGILHIGAHNCEELEIYNKALKTNSQNIIWIEAILSKVIEAKQRNIPNVYNAVITDKDDDLHTFNIADKSDSSSIYDFKTHILSYPEISYKEHIVLKTVTLDTFFERNNINPKLYNIWNLIIQGAELLALKGATKSMEFADIIITKVFIDELYKGCSMIGEMDTFMNVAGFLRIITEIKEQGWGEAVYMNQKFKI